MDGRTKAAISFSCIWVLGWVVYVCWYLIKPDANMTPNTWGDFMAGGFAPLAFLWLVVAFFQQGELLRQNTKSIDIQQQELQNNNEILKLQHEELQASTKALTLQYEEMKKAAEQAAVQAKAISANETHARRDVLFRFIELIETDLSQLTSEMLRMVSHDAFVKAREEYEAGLKGSFSFALLENLKPGQAENSVARLYVGGLWPKTADKFCAQFDGMARHVRGVENDEFLISTIETTKNAELAKRIKELRLDFLDIVEFDEVRPGGDIDKVQVHLSVNRRSRGAN